jgi:ABC-type molybdate transport system substrate-binding protein
MNQGRNKCNRDGLLQVSITLSILFHVANVATVGSFLPVGSETGEDASNVVTRYLNFLRSSSAKAIFERYGFSYLIKPTL